MPISELSKKLDLPAHTLRYWEKEFPEKISPVTGAGGRRYYRPETVLNITAIKNYLYAQGYTIDGVKKLIREDTFDTSLEQAVPHTPTPTSYLLTPNSSKEDIDTAIDLLESALSDLSVK
jgi:DNA-binding transcriptional MerR regulator